MPIQSKKPLIIALCVLAAVLVVGAVYVLVMYFLGAPKNVLVKTFVCPDDSHYIVVQEEDRLLISGGVFNRIEETSRYSNGASEVDLGEGSFTLKTGETTVTCTAGVPASGVPPISNQ